MIRKRCAIYTRKSTDEGLDLSFNSLDAQREACEAYVVSQRHEGWVLIKTAYDDGGFSGGTMERPALQQLLTDIRKGLVDIVVVYKIDRLTRALSDFAKIVEVFDARGVSFVSITQQFSTTTSMGRLTLNVLLSFAQFEREVTAERIRDKIAASKKKGMWMGGLPPLGYDVHDKKLVVNPAEAEHVCRLFEAYLRLGSTKSLMRWAKDNEIATKRRFHPDGRVRSGNRPFSRGNLHALLNYRTYIGEVTHKGAVYAGEHEALLPRDLWDKVQAKLSRLPNRRGAKQGQVPALLLTGFVFDETGDRLTPVHASKGGRRYYYYISARLNQAEVRDPSGWRLPAPALERAVVQGLTSFLQDDQQMQAMLTECGAAQTDPVHILQHILNASQQLTVKLGALDIPDQLQMTLSIIDRIDLSVGQMTIRIKTAALLVVLGHAGEAGGSADADEAVYTISLPLVLKRRGVETRLIIGNGKDTLASPDQRLIRTIAKAHMWFEDLKSATVTSINDIATRENIPACEVSRQLPLAFLAPRIVKAILAGHQSPDVTVKSLLRLKDLPLDWRQQSQRLGF